MKSTTLALFLSLFAVHAQAAEAAPAQTLSTGLACLLFLSMPVMFWLFFHSLFRKRVFSVNPNRRRWLWAAVWAVVPFLYLLPFGFTELYLITLVPLFPVAAALDRVLGAADSFVGWSLAAVGWSLLGMLFASFRTRLLNRRAKRAAAALSPEPQPAPER